MLPNSHDEANIILKSKPNEDITIKLEINTLINIHVKILNKKYYQTESINICQKKIHHDSVAFIPGNNNGSTFAN